MRPAAEVERAANGLWCSRGEEQGIRVRAGHRESKKKTGKKHTNILIPRGKAFLVMPKFWFSSSLFIFAKISAMNIYTHPCYRGPSLDVAHISYVRYTADIST